MRRTRLVATNLERVHIRGDWELGDTSHAAGITQTTGPDHLLHEPLYHFEWSLHVDRDRSVGEVLDRAGQAVAPCGLADARPIEHPLNAPDR